MNNKQRLDFFLSRRDQPRMWWFERFAYLPQIYAALTDEEFDVLAEWFETTERERLIGECGVPAMSAMLGFVEGNGIGAIVQCGHYSGFSTLMLGWALRRMGCKRGLFSMDINAKMTDFTRRWVQKAGLEEYVHCEISDSSERKAALSAYEYLEGPPQMVFVDSSHQYAHTLAELKLWSAELEPGGLIFLHDVGEMSVKYDTTGQGGVLRAVEEFGGACLINRKEEWQVYQDGNGLGILQVGG